MIDPVAPRVFLAHSNQDKPLVREIYHLLRLDGFDPWLDSESLLPGQHWEIEIERAISSSHAVVLFVNSSQMNRPGYLHKEITMAIDVAEKQPDGAIYIVPVRVPDKLPDELSYMQPLRLTDREMPDRLKHLQWILASCSKDEVVDLYSDLQLSLLARARELGLINQSDLAVLPKRKTGGIKQMLIRPLEVGNYLVRGCNPDESRYYGTARVGRVRQQYRMISNIGGRIARYDEETSSQGVMGTRTLTTMQGKQRVTYESQKWNCIYNGTWGDGGTEYLIPASPLADIRPRRSTYLGDTKHPSSVRDAFLNYDALATSFIAERSILTPSRRDGRRRKTREPGASARAAPNQKGEK